MLVRPVPARDVVVEELHAELCLMRLDTSDVLVLNRTASDIWLLADGNSDTEHVISTLAVAYGLRPDEIRSQVEAVLDEMEHRGFLVEHQTAP